MNMLTPLDLIAEGAKKNFLDFDFDEIERRVLAAKPLPSRYTYKVALKPLPISAYFDPSDTPSDLSWPTIEYLAVPSERNPFDPMTSRMYSPAPKPMEMKPAPHVIAKDLRAAADVIEQRGLAQNAFWTGSGDCYSPVCTYAALAIAAGGQQPGQSVADVLGGMNHDVAVRLRAAGEELVGGSFDVCGWNNRPSNNGHSVVNAMRATAARLDAQ